jgi:magnesium transporter|tara:strand:+ start:11477 stop:12829 length:1353 start_codon:yes stop_codon:yes gene_type:complete
MLNKFEINNKLIDNLESLIIDKDTITIAKILQEVHPADIADIIEQLSEKNAQFLFKVFENPKSADIIIELEDDVRESILSVLSARKIAKDLIDNLESDDAADVIAELPDEKKENVLSHIKNKVQAEDISDLLKYPENSAGSLMAKELVKVNENWTTLKCLKEMRKQAEKIKNIHTIYVVNDSNKLLGLLSLKRLLVIEKSTTIKSITNRDIISVKTNERNEDVANIMNKYDLIVIPVVDEKNILLGRITIDDILDFVKEEAEKDYQMASGISEDVVPNDNIWNITKARLPWLLIGLIGGILGAKIIGIFDLKNNLFELAFFIPLITAMGGNVGVQSAAIVVQGLANNNLKVNNISNKLFKELGVAIFNGLICSTIILLVTMLIGYSMAISITVSISLLAVIIFAALFGTFIPLILEKYKIDPALATGPFITTINDILGLLIYFIIGKNII